MTEILAVSSSSPAPSHYPFQCGFLEASLGTVHIPHLQTRRHARSRKAWGTRIVPSRWRRFKHFRLLFWALFSTVAFFPLCSDTIESSAGSTVGDELGQNAAAIKDWILDSAFLQSSGAVWESRWPSWAFRPNESYGFRGRKAILNHAHALVSACSSYVNQHPRTLSNTSAFCFCVSRFGLAVRR